MGEGLDARSSRRAHALARSQACRAQAPQSFSTGRLTALRTSNDGHLVTCRTASGTRGALAHGRRNLNQLADLPFRQWRLKISRGYRLLHDGIETDDPARRHPVLPEEFITPALRAHSPHPPQL